MLQTFQTRESCLYQNRVDNSMVTCNKCFHPRLSATTAEGQKLHLQRTLYKSVMNVAKKDDNKGQKRFPINFFLSRMYFLTGVSLLLMLTLQQFQKFWTNLVSSAELSAHTTLTVTLRLHVRSQPSFGRRQRETKTSANGTNLTKSALNCIHNAGSCARLCHMPMAQLMKSHVCHEFACPIMPRAPPCTSRIPKQHLLDPPVRGQIRNIASFPSCLKHCSDQAFNPCCCASATTLPFQ